MNCPLRSRSFAAKSNTGTPTAKFLSNFCSSSSSSYTFARATVPTSGIVPASLPVPPFCWGKLFYYLLSINFLAEPRLHCRLLTAERAPALDLRVNTYAALALLLNNVPNAFGTLATPLNPLKAAIPSNSSNHASSSPSPKWAGQPTSSSLVTVRK
ncbi:unnamed protein product [Dicrocoelium dendriticum]|nr:unnamed protein product [Dicrocoelium dendriticum]